MTKEFIKAANNNDIGRLKQILIDNKDIKDFINRKNTTGYTALIKASAKGNYEAVEFLLSEGANPNTYMKCQNLPVQTALSRSCGNGYTKIAALLIEKGAEVNCSSTQTPLVNACSSGNISTVSMLFDNEFNKADVNLQNVSIGATGKHRPGWTSLMNVCYKGDKSMFELLIQKDAKTDIQDWNGRTALMLLCNYMNNDGWTIKAKESMAEHLIQIGADIDLKDSNGKTAGDMATGNIKAIIEKILLEREVDEQEDIQFNMFSSAAEPTATQDATSKTQLQIEHEILLGMIDDDVEEAIEPDQDEIEPQAELTGPAKTFADRSALELKKLKARDIDRDSELSMGL